MSDDEPPSSDPETAGPRPAFDVSVEITAPGWREVLPTAAAMAREAAEAALAAAGFGPLAHMLEVGIRLAGDPELRALNARFRGIDRPTNVLAFPATDCRPGRLPAPPAEGAPIALGDVAVAYETAAREARAAARPLADHLRHLVVHGVLHLAGHDHKTDAEAAAMEALEARALERLGAPDPYRSAGSDEPEPCDERSPAA